ncbi:hypothetical protein LPTSP2_37010 [Leptospira ellinghausenii]|uniref:Uncharacterized protein n=2 Tax=Leptospiraceae TaxID=170 RepID=A0A2P2DIF6_9LEPT|nr:hypothetical protein LPTSP2_37010 [Leptospira ellinghausenii]
MEELKDSRSSEFFKIFGTRKMNSVEAIAEGYRILCLHKNLPQEAKDLMETLIRTNFKLEKEILELKKGKNNG